MKICPFCLKIKSLNEIVDCKFLDKTEKLETIANATVLVKAVDLTKEVMENYFEFLECNRYLFPHYWNLSENTNEVKIIKINKNDNHFKNLRIGNSEGKIIEQLNSTNSSIGIYRIQNKMLYLKYINECKKKVGKEYILFHGSPSKNYSNIILQGFDVGYSKKGSYGYGIYFSEKIKTSLSFSTNKDNEVLVCKVFLTEEDVSNDYCKVIQNDFRIYPMYLIKNCV